MVGHSAESAPRSLRGGGHDVAAVAADEHHGRQVHRQDLHPGGQEAEGQRLAGKRQDAANERGHTPPTQDTERDASSIKRQCTRASPGAGGGVAATNVHEYDLGAAGTLADEVSRAQDTNGLAAQVGEAVHIRRQLGARVGLERWRSEGLDPSLSAALVSLPSATAAASTPFDSVVPSASPAAGSAAAPTAAAAAGLEPPASGIGAAGEASGTTSLALASDAAARRNGDGRAERVAAGGGPPSPSPWKLSMSARVTRVGKYVCKVSRDSAEMFCSPGGRRDETRGGDTERQTMDASGTPLQRTLVAATPAQTRPRTSTSSLMLSGSAGKRSWCSREDSLCRRCWARRVLSRSCSLGVPVVNTRSCMP